MHYEPVSFKPLLFVPTTFNEDPSTGIASLDKYIGANPSIDYKPAANIRGKLLHMGADANCPPTIKGDIQKFNEYCQRLSRLFLESPPSWTQSPDVSFLENLPPAVEAPGIIEHTLSGHEITADDELSDGEGIPDDSMPQELSNELGQQEESGSVDLSAASSSDDDELDAYMEYLYPDTSLQRSQIDWQPLPQVSYASEPVYFINPFAPSEIIEPIEPFGSFEPPEPSSSMKRPYTSKVVSTSRKKARKDYPSVSVSASSSSFSSSEFEGNDAADDILSEYPPGHSRSAFRKDLCKDGGFKYTCRKCPDFSTRATGDMRRHMESLAHKPKKDHICKYPKCGGSFTRKDALKRHQQSKKHLSSVVGVEN
ncbi:hypothetical protein D9619_007832 [Psilocybe cf. subviscida]|uniref:C2H2-type domain-containing protein n=1 Tax=Psilocybe cf. subviscida TaxID=2480587 RepID=A0A8H5ATP7_9AGAR|nr:hypothetical protein D9619_007832 [Psilocybe cf. subviscida]